MRAAIYARVSTSSKTAGEFDQDPAVQLEPLTRYISERRWNLYKIYVDRANGAEESRPDLNKLMKAARQKKFDVLVVWRFDRFARSLKHLVSALEEFWGLGIGFISYMEAIDTSTAAGRLMFQLIGAMAEFERSLIRERVSAGMAYAREHGTQSGNPIGRPGKVFPKGAVAQLIAGGLSLRAAARQLGIGYGTAQRDLIQNPLPSTVRDVLKPMLERPYY